jgi:four helix bundle protein
MTRGSPVDLLPDLPLRRTIFSYERLDVYVLALEFVSVASRIGQGLPRGNADLADQLRRASTSVVLNTAEGSGEFSPKEKARFYRMALRSLAECSALVDVARQQEAVSQVRFDEAKEMMSRLVAMLTVLIRQQEKRA